MQKTLFNIENLRDALLRKENDCLYKENIKLKNKVKEQAEIIKNYNRLSRVKLKN